jgi:polyhydroxybutyrate depolymerase
MRTWVYFCLGCLIPACGDDALKVETDTPETSEPIEDVAQVESDLAEATSEGVDVETLTGDTATDSPLPEDSSDVDAATDTVPPTIDTSPLGGDRPAALVLPDGFDPRRPTPVVILLHGYSATGTLQDLYLGVSETAKTRGVVTIVPEGTRNAAGLQFWNAAPAWCCDFTGSGVDDQGYLMGLLDEAETRFAVDPKRIFIIGHSNGGFMAHRLACAESPRIAAIASIAGSLPLDAGGCTPSAPVSVLQIHGTLDATILYGGALGQYPSAETVTERWAGHNACQVLPVEADDVDYDNVIFGRETTPLRYPECAEGVDVTLWKMAGSGHVPGFTSDFMPNVFDWLEAHPRPK